jgi:hypothetical protein
MRKIARKNRRTIKMVSISPDIPLLLCKLHAGIVPGKPNS